MTNPPSEQKEYKRCGENHEERDLINIAVDELMTPPSEQKECVRTRNGEPEGYVQWHVWAEKMSKQYEQIKCPKCGLYHIWKRKPKDTPPVEAVKHPITLDHRDKYVELLNSDSTPPQVKQWLREAPGGLSKLKPSAELKYWLETGELSHDR